MKLRRAAALLLVALVSGTATSNSQPTSTDQWSPAVDGIRARLIAVPTENGGRPQLRLELELENVSDSGNPIEIWWTGLSSMLDLALEDETGKALPRISAGGNELTPLPFWLPILHQSSLRVVVAAKAYEYRDPDRVFLRPMVFQEWALAPSASPSRLFIRGTLTPKDAPERSERRNQAWRGPLKLPRAEIPTTPMLWSQQSAVARCEPVFTPIADNRAMPNSFVEQGLQSLPNLYPRHVLLLERRGADIGSVPYALLVYKQDAASDVVTIEGAATWRSKAWVFTTSCASSSAMRGLVTTLERVAALAR
jgi:hypothetical protein